MKIKFSDKCSGDQTPCAQHNPQISSMYSYDMESEVHNCFYVTERHGNAQSVKQLCTDYRLQSGLIILTEWVLVWNVSPQLSVDVA